MSTVIAGVIDHSLNGTTGVLVLLRSFSSGDTNLLVDDSFVEFLVVRCLLVIPTNAPKPPTLQALTVDLFV